jgi:hypothetical protein
MRSRCNDTVPWSKNRNVELRRFQIYEVSHFEEKVPLLFLFDCF